MCLYISRVTFPTARDLVMGGRRNPHMLRCQPVHATFPRLMTSRIDLYHGLFRWERAANGQPELSRHADAPASIPDPHSGRLLHIATVDARARGICPSCATTGQGGYVSFVQ